MCSKYIGKIIKCAKLTNVYIVFDGVSIVNREPDAGRTILPGTKFNTSLNGTSFFS